MARILLPTPLRPYAEGAASIDVAGSTVADALTELVERHPQLRKHLYDDAGRVRSFVNLYKNDEDVRYLERESTPLAADDALSIVPSIAGGATDAASLSNEEIRRYSRHLIMPEVGVEGQKKLKAARVLAIGAGGLGSPLAVYLAAAGVGTIGLVDNDVVDDSNLQRQILYGVSDVGRPKLQAAAERLRDMNSNVEVVPYETRLTSENALEIFRDYDIIADGTDNFPTRYLVNDACVLTGKPNVYASIFRFEGQASVFWAQMGPCYRCLYTEPPPPGLVPSCAEGGVLGILPGLLGVIQATETVKLILGNGEPLIGRLLLVDALSMRFRELKLRKNPDCVICGANPTVTKLIDYEQFCGIPQAEASTVAETGRIPEVTVRELKAMRDRGEDFVLVDVREPHEIAICAFPESVKIPLGTLPQSVNRLSTADEIVVHCKMGGRSAKAVQFLLDAGFRKVRNLAGGIDRWAQEIEPGMPRY
ncbi:MAG TPA: molybdopterin-synthase adenylyltransferase MoeB [Thermoanaerobaculia bacterium]|jgi:adenylyltransferase/sulfurtransferase|nr:molybdopterin-synthase adenylyltransferase MoeB [Thermoanaerobaculia bacterium]